MTKKTYKVEKDQKKIYRIERAPSDHSVLGHGSSKIVMPNTRNEGYFTLIDSSEVDSSNNFQPECFFHLPLWYSDSWLGIMRL